MAIEYREEHNKKIEKQIQKLLTDAPSYVNDYYKHMHNGRREISTQLSYIRDVIDFLKYEQSVLPQYKDSTLSQIPLELLQSLRLTDIEEYRDYLKNHLNIGNASTRKRFSALSSFYKYLNNDETFKNNPMTNFETPAINKKRIIALDSSLSNRLLAGILANDRYLIDSGNGDYVVEIDEPVRIKREPLVLRNYAICCLFLGSGLRVSELVGLDLDDINFKENSLTVIAKGGDETSVFFGTDVAAALRQYINGLPLPSEILDKYSDNPDLIEWTKVHIYDTDFSSNLIKIFPSLDDDEEVKRDLLNVRNSMLRQGRSFLKPKRNNNAVFITTRGTRMSVRSVELMIKEMVKTYLPDYEDKDKFSPHKLRATCASRILTQTNDLSLASTQLNHKGIEVTAAFYIAIEKRRQQRRVQGLDINKW